MKLDSTMLINLLQAADQGADILVDDHSITIEWPETNEGYDAAFDLGYQLRHQYKGDRRYTFCNGTASLYIREEA